MDIKSMLKRPMVSNFISLVLLQGVNYVLPLLSFPYLYYVLGVERWGLISFGYSFIQYFVMFTDFGFNLSGTKYIAEHRQEPKEVNLYLNSAFVGRLILGMLSFIILLAVILFVPRFQIEATFYLLYFGIIIGNIMFPMWFFQGMEKMKYITIFNLIAKSLSLLPLFFIVRHPNQYIYVPICYSLGYIIAGGFSIYFIYYKTAMKWYIPPIHKICFALKDSSSYFLSRASLSLFATSNTFVLGLVCGNTITGYYAAAEKLYQAYDQLVFPFSGVLFPHMAKTHDVSFFRKIFSKITLFNVLFVIIVLLCSYWIIDIIYHPGNENILIAFRILLIACLWSIPAILIGYPFLAAMGHPNYTNMTVIITAFFHITMLIVLYLFNQISIPNISMLVVCSQFLLLSLRVFGIKKYNLLQNKQHGR